MDRLIQETIFISKCTKKNVWLKIDELEDFDYIYQHSGYFN